MTLPERVVHGDVAERVGLALELIPARVRELIGPVPLFEGDVEFAAVVPFALGSVTYTSHWGDERTARRVEMAMCHWERRRNVSRSWLSVPYAAKGYENAWLVATVLHEMGHALWNQVIRRAQKPWRVFADWDGRVAIRTDHSGLVPPMIPLVNYMPENIGEQWAEAFRVWLSPRWLLEEEWLPGRFYVGSRTRIDPWGVRQSNLSVLALFNELAGWPSDRPPRALR